MKIFRVNEHITLQLEDETTVIYVDGERFFQCKYLLLTFDKEKMKEYSQIDSIDKAAEALDATLERKTPGVQLISSEAEFWGHCSNLQAWVESGYDTRILHRNLAFPLLKKLTEAGDPLAERAFKEEIVKRMESGHPTVVNYLIAEGYVNYLSDEERLCFLDQESISFLEHLEDQFKHKFRLVDSLHNEDHYCFTIRNNKLTGLSLYHCDMESIPDFILDYPYLTYLNLQHNCLPLLTDEISKLSKLKTLNISHNKLSHLSNSLGKLTRLKYLNLKNNKLETLPESLLSLKLLERIDLSHNSFQDVPSVLQILPELFYLNSDNNPLTKDALQKEKVNFDETLLYLVSFFDKLFKMSFLRNNIERNFQDYKRLYYKYESGEKEFPIFWDITVLINSDLKNRGAKQVENNFGDEEKITTEKIDSILDFIQYIHHSVFKMEKQFLTPFRHTHRFLSHLNSAHKSGKLQDKTFYRLILVTWLVSYLIDEYGVTSDAIADHLKPQAVQDILEEARFL